MDADLVRAAGLKAQANQREVFMPQQHAVLGDGRFAAFGLGPYAAAHGGPVGLGDGRVDCALLLGRAACEDGQVFAAEVGRVQLCLKEVLGVGVLGTTIRPLVPRSSRLTGRKRKG